MRAWMTYSVLIAALLGSAQAPRAGELMPNVLVTVPAMKPYVDELLSGIAESKNLLRAGQDAHHFSLSSSQRAALASADVIIVADREMNPFLNKLLDAEAKRGAKIIALTALPGAEPLAFAKENPWLEAAKKEAATQVKTDDNDGHEHHPHDDHTHADEKTSDAVIPLDPHLWLDPIRMANMASPLAEAIATTSPNHRGTLQTNATKLSAHLRTEVDPAIRHLLAQKTHREATSSKPVIPFITYHAAYQYFMKRYGLEHRGELFQRPEDYLGARTLRDIIAQSGKVKINCLISETQGPLVTRIAKNSGANVIVLSPEEALPQSAVTSASWVRNDYDRMLQKTAESFAGCL